jgi:Trypsin-like peptidase domain
LSGVPYEQRIVEVISDHGHGHRYGSGLLVGGRQLLTAAHVVVGAVAVDVRGPDKVRRAAVLNTALIGDPDKLDLALLEVPTLAQALPAMPGAVVNRQTTTGDMVEGWAVGYPEWAEVRRNGGSVGETAQVVGFIPPLSDLVKRLLSLEVTRSQRRLPEAGVMLEETDWRGMSGAAVFAQDAIVGVVTEHDPKRGPSDITVTPLARLDDPRYGPANPAEWWARLGLTELRILPVEAIRAQPAYRATLQALRGRTQALIGRDAELAKINAFAAGDDDAFGAGTAAGGYLWLVGAPWAGKSALLAEAVYALPPQVDVVPYFLVSRAAEDSQENSSRPSSRSWPGCLTETHQTPPI